VTAGSTALGAFPICPESGPHTYQFIVLQSLLQIFYSVHLKSVPEKPSFGWQTRIALDNDTIHFKLRQPK
jgi:hypothetical protein